MSYRIGFLTADFSGCFVQLHNFGGCIASLVLSYLVHLLGY